jgi:hypothetical protein
MDLFYIVISERPPGPAKDHIAAFIAWGFPDRFRQTDCSAVPCTCCHFIEIKNSCAYFFATKSTLCAPPPRRVPILTCFWHE